MKEFLVEPVAKALRDILGSTGSVDHVSFRLSAPAPLPTPPSHLSHPFALHRRKPFSRDCQEAAKRSDRSVRTGLLSGFALRQQGEPPQCRARQKWCTW